MWKFCLTHTIIQTNYIILHIWLFGPKYCLILTVLTWNMMSGRRGESIWSAITQLPSCIIHLALSCPRSALWEGTLVERSCENERNWAELFLTCRVLVSSPLQPVAVPLRDVCTDGLHHLRSSEAFHTKIKAVNDNQLVLIFSNKTLGLRRSGSKTGKWLDTMFSQ